MPLTVSVQTALRRAYLPHLAQAGCLGELIARQAEVCAKYERNEQLHGATCANLPNDIINFQHDPLACAIALGWSEGVDVATIPLTYTIQDGWLHETPASDGVPTRVVTKIDGDAFNEFWYSLLCH